MLILVAALTSSNGKGRLFQTFNAFTKKGTDAVNVGLDLPEGQQLDDVEKYKNTPAYYKEGSGEPGKDGTLSGGTWSATDPDAIDAKE